MDVDLGRTHWRQVGRELSKLVGGPSCKLVRDSSCGWLMDIGMDEVNRAGMGVESSYPVYCTNGLTAFI